MSKDNVPTCLGYITETSANKILQILASHPARKWLERVEKPNGKGSLLFYPTRARADGYQNDAIRHWKSYLSGMCRAFEFLEKESHAKKKA